LTRDQRARLERSMAAVLDGRTVVAIRAWRQPGAS
jgi:hypothetical protein